MSKKFNVKDIISARKNELDHSPLFQPQPTSVSKNISSTIHQIKDRKKQTNKMPAYQKARKMVFAHVP